VRAPSSVASLLRRMSLRAWPALLDSSGGPRELARWSFWAYDPMEVLTHDGRTSRVVDRAGGVRAGESNPFAALRAALGRFALPSGEAASPLRAGAIGFMAYEVGRHVERLPQTVSEDIALPRMHWGLYDSVLSVDHWTGEAMAWACDAGGESPSDRLDAWESLLSEADEAAASGGASANTSAAGAGESRAAGLSGSGGLESTFTRASYEAAVRRAIEYIGAGDIFQVNLSQRFTARPGRSPVELYVRLRESNPAPFAAYLGGAGGGAAPLGEGEWAVLSSSPERFLRVTGRHVETRPIKGTRPRRAEGEAGAAAFNAQQRSALWDSAKEAAELAMIVDLERNDLGRVCGYGTVRVTEPRTVEAYASVYHTAAQVEGALHERYDVADLLRATFPGGSITGAPKVRAMEIIDELEPTARSVYTGAVGYVGFDGRADLNVAIRTLIADGPRVHVQVGGGIVADSTPAGEYEETLAKGRGMFEALGVRV